MLPCQIIFLQYVPAEADKGNQTKLPIPVSKQNNDKREILSSGGMNDLAAKLVSVHRCILYRHSLVVGKGLAAKVEVLYCHPLSAKTSENKSTQTLQIANLPVQPPHSSFS